MRLKFNPLPEVLAGKRVVVVDDSIVRGTTTGADRRHAAPRRRARGPRPDPLAADEVPVLHGRRHRPPRRADRRHPQLDEIRTLIDADSLGYLSQEGLLAAVGARGRGAAPLHRLLRRPLPASTCRSTSTSSRWSAADGMGRTYREAGVDIDEARRAVELIAAGVRRHRHARRAGRHRRLRQPLPLDTEPYPDPVLVASTDGVGTKLKVAIALGRHDTIGVDLVHHCINDIAVQGADPLFFLDYLATGRLRARRGRGDRQRHRAAACAASGAGAVGGETAELPDLYQGEDFDLAGFIVGVAARRDVIDGSGVRAGDALIGLPSSGPAHQRLLAGARSPRRRLVAGPGD